MPLTIAEYTPDAFASRIGEYFRFTTEDERAPRGLELNLTLLQVRGSRQPEKPDANEREPFSLLFATQEDVPFLQGLCRLQHPDFASEQVFLTRVMPPRGKSSDQHRSYYEAVFG